MAISLNTKVSYVDSATSYTAFPVYGKVMIGDKAFEFYNDQHVEDYIQIPHEEVDHLVASCLFKGKYIPRFAIVTKNAGTFTFSTRHNKKTLKEYSKYVDKTKMFKSLTFIQTITRGLKRIFKRK